MFFVYVGHRVTKSITLYNSQQAALIAESDAHLTSSKEVNFRKRANRNMWIIIGTIFVVVTYNTLYSFILLVASD